MTRSNNGANARRARHSASLLSLDKPLIIALGALVAVYSVITLATYYRVADTNRSDSEYQEFSSLSSSSSSSDTLAAAAATPTAAAAAATMHQIQRLFPIHVGQDVEQIVHPGLVMVQPALVPANVARTLTVPKFFDESHGHYYYGGVRAANHTIRHYLGDGDSLLTPAAAATIGSYHTASDGERRETIYCSVASYRDPECTGSIEDLYARAQYPGRIRVAILDQRVAGDPVCARPAAPCAQNPAQALCRYRHLIDVYEMDAVLAVGPVFARHLAHRHYRGEYFAMQIDSHVRFTEHWDSDIQGQWESARNEMGVLSTYLSDIIGSIDPVTHAGIHPGRPIMCESDYEGAGSYKHLRHGQQPEGEAGIKGEPTLHPFWAAGFSFARGHFAIQVPYDQHLPMVFQGEEISIGLRGFTYGYDYYAAERSVCFHMYAIKENEEKRKKVPLFWEHSALYAGVGGRAMKRLNAIIGMADFPASEWHQADLHKYGLGNVRQKEKFFDLYGIDTKNQTVQHHLCSFVGKPMMRVFKPALRENGMGLDYDKIDYKFVDPRPEKEKPPEDVKKS